MPDRRGILVDRGELEQLIDATGTHAPQEEERGGERRRPTRPKPLDNVQRRPIALLTAVIPTAGAATSPRLRVKCSGNPKDALRRRLRLSCVVARAGPVEHHAAPRRWPVVRAQDVDAGPSDRVGSSSFALQALCGGLGGRGVRSLSRRFSRT